MRRRVDQWLSRKRGRQDQLLRWLRGLDGTGGSDEQPYLWVIAGLPEGGDRPGAEVELAREAARLLDSKLDLGKPVWERNRLLYNLLSLCAELNRPDQLADSLYQVWKRRKLAGRFEGIDLRDRLRAALAGNQSDDGMLKVWEDMLGRGRDRFLPGNKFDAFYGVLLLPLRIHKPRFDALGKALKSLADYMGKDRATRRSRFMAQLERVRQVLSTPPWDQELIFLAERSKWPEWTAKCFTPPIVPLQNGNGSKTVHYLLPAALGVGLEAGFRCKAEQKLVHEQVFKVPLNNGALVFVERFSPSFHRLLNEPSFKSESSWVGSLAHAILDAPVGKTEAARQTLDVSRFEALRNLLPATYLRPDDRSRTSLTS